MSARRPVRRYGTPAHLASAPGAPKRPAPRYGRAELRQRRNDSLTAHYTAEFSLAAEIADVAGPLAARVAAAPRPTRFRLPVNWLAEATHEAVHEVVGWLAEVDARRRTVHLKDEPGKRRYAMTTLIDLAQRPGLPEIDDAALADGSWAAALTALADGIDARLAALLAQSYPPGAAGLRGRASRSEQLAQLLGRTIDRAARELTHRLDAADGGDQPDPAEATGTPTDRARAELAALGVNTAAI